MAKKFDSSRASFSICGRSQGCSSFREKLSNGSAVGGRIYCLDCSISSIDCPAIKRCEIKTARTPKVEKVSAFVRLFTGKLRVCPNWQKKKKVPSYRCKCSVENCSVFFILLTFCYLKNGNWQWMTAAINYYYFLRYWELSILSKY